MRSEPEGSGGLLIGRAAAESSTSTRPHRGAFSTRLVSAAHHVIPIQLGAPLPAIYSEPMAEDDINDISFDAVEDDEDDEARLPSLHDVLRSLPLVDGDHYIGMQATNLAIVAAMLEPMEEDVAGEYAYTDRLPIEGFMRVSALSQLWIFGVYEFLRTWRQWVEDVLRRCSALDQLGAESREQRLKQELGELRRPSSSSPGGIPYSRGLERAALDSGYRQRLQEALYRSDVPFRRIEAVRVHLAKHEVPKGNEYGSGAGYGRIDIDRSVQFHVPLGDNEVTMVSRRGIERDLRRMADGSPLFVISEELQKAVAKLPKSSYGIRRVRMTLDDGTAHEGAIAWTRHIVWVKGYPMPPFEATRVVAIEEL